MASLMSFAGRPKKPKPFKGPNNTRFGFEHSEDEPILTRGWPKMPKDIAPGARKYWDEFCKVIDEHMVLTPQHARGVQQLCEAYAKLAEAQARVREEGLVLSTRYGVQKMNPSFVVEMNCHRLFLLYLGQFGLTPATVGRLHSLEAPKRYHHPRQQIDRNAKAPRDVQPAPKDEAPPPRVTNGGGSLVVGRHGFLK